MSHSSVAAVTTSLSHEDARGILNEWGRRGLFRVRKLGDAVDIQSITPLSCYTVRLKTQYEHRYIRSQSSPYSGGPIDDKGTPPAMWAMPFSAPEEFGKSRLSSVVPHTDRVTTCGNCGGNGRVSCSSCGGSGRTNCMMCGGSGTVMKTDYRSRTDYVWDYHTQRNEPRTVYENVQVSQMCYSCSGGKVTCSRCGGSGRVTCGTCNGYGRVKIYDVLTVKFNNSEHSGVVNQSQIPDRKLMKVTGNIHIDERLPFIKVFSGVTPEVTLSVEELIAKSQEIKVKEGEMRILFQRLIIESLEAWQVTYSRNGRPPKNLWIYGNERRVYSVGLPPLALWRVSLAVVAVALLLFFIVGLNNRNSSVEQTQPTAQEIVQLQAARTMQNLNLRAGPGSSFAKIKEISINERVYLLPDIQTVGESTWVKIRSGSNEGWVNDKYLSRE